MAVVLWVALILLALVFLAGGALIVLNARQGKVSVSSPDLEAGSIAGCPASPNCVSTAAAPDDSRHRIEPMQVREEHRTRPVAELVGEIAEVIAALDATRVTEAGDRWLRATAVSRLFRFVDDIDVLVDPERGLIHLRSASRVGEGDMGVNRTRANRIEAALQRKGLI